MARTRPRPEEPQPVPEAEAKKPSRHREQDTDRKQNNAPQDARRNIEVIFGSIAKRTPQKSGHKYSDRTIASVSGIFKSHARAKKSRRREKTPPLITALEDGLDEARCSISDKTHDSFAEVHDRFTERINDLERNDKQFYDAVFRKASLLSAPLVEEKVDTLVRQNDGSSKQQEIVIGDRVAAFKAVIETEDEKLKKLWRQWDELQEEYIKLGVEVFGPVKFGGSAAEYRDLEGGYRKDMEYWELEHGVLIEEIGNEVENIGVKVLQKLRNTEKSLDAAAKKEQARLLQSIME